MDTRHGKVSTGRERGQVRNITLYTRDLGECASGFDMVPSADVHVSERRPTFSLIVPTLGRTKELGALFESMVASQVTDFEVIMVDQNQNASLDGLCQRYSKSFSLKHLKVKWRGAARARNYGALFASGTYLNFPDDDCMLQRDTLALAQELLAGMNLKLLTGMSVDPAGNASTTEFIEDEQFLTLQGIWGRFIEFSMFVEREAFLRIGGYDERFGVGSTYGADEGADLLIRLLPTISPRQAYYTYRVKFIHPDKQNDYSAIGEERAFNYARGRGALFAKWPTVVLLPMTLRYIAASALGGLVFPGAKGRTYQRRLRGFLSGYVEFRKAPLFDNTGRTGG